MATCKVAGIVKALLGARMELRPDANRRVERSGEMA